MQDEQMFEGAEKYYDDLIHKYQEGNPDTLNLIRGMIKALLINEEELKGKAPAELNQYIEDLCTRFGVSKSQIEKLSKKFNI